MYPKKNPNSVKNTLVSCHFFPLFQIITALMPIFYKRNVPSKKYRVLFLYFSRKNHFSYAHILLEKRPPAKNKLLLCPFFPKFNEKLLLSCPYSVKRRSFSKKHAALMPIFCQKNVHSLKKRYSRLIFFSFFFMKNPCFHAHF